MKRVDKIQDEEKYPLSRSLFAFASTRKEQVKIHLHRYDIPTNVKTTQPRITRLSMTFNEFQRLLKAERQLARQYNQQMSALFVSRARKQSPRSPETGRDNNRTDAVTQIPEPPSAFSDNCMDYEGILNFRQLAYEREPTNCQEAKEEEKKKKKKN